MSINLLEKTGKRGRTGLGTKETHKPKRVILDGVHSPGALRLILKEKGLSTKGSKDILVATLAKDREDKKKVSRKESGLVTITNAKNQLIAITDQTDSLLERIRIGAPKRIKSQKGLEKADTYAMLVRQAIELVKKSFAHDKQLAHLAHKKICADEKEKLIEFEELREVIDKRKSKYIKKVRKKELKAQNKEAKKIQAQVENELLLEMIEAKEAGDEAEVAEIAEALEEKPAEVDLALPVAPSTEHTKTVMLKRYRLIDIERVKMEYLRPKAIDHLKVTNLVRELGFRAAAEVGGIEVYEKPSFRKKGYN